MARALRHHHTGVMSTRRMQARRAAYRAVSLVSVVAALRQSGVREGIEPDAGGGEVWDRKREDLQGLSAAARMGKGDEPTLTLLESCVS